MEDDADLACSFCAQRSPAVKLIRGPNAVICSDCVRECTKRALEQGANLSKTGVMQATRVVRSKRIGLPCNFCGMPQEYLVRPASRSSLYAHICFDCLALCQDIIRS